MARILVVDDEEDVVSSLQRRLEREGYEVTTAGSMAEAKQAIRSADPSFDVVLTDMLMEETDAGKEVLREALQRDIFTEVIVLTAYGNVANAVECLKMGAFDYIEKNIPGVDVFDLVVLKIEQALDRRRWATSTVRQLEEFRKAALSSEEGEGAVPAEDG